MPFTFQRLAIPDVMLIRPKVFDDERGFFLESYKWSDFAEHGITEHFVQDNHSRSARHVLRGLHYQRNPKAQGKLIRCMKGAILDVAVDIRRGSPYFGKWVWAELSDLNVEMLYIPPGFAHGFLVLSEHAEMYYKTTEEYAPDEDRGIIWNDQVIGIKWPVSSPVLSEKDMGHPVLQNADINYEYEGALL